MRLPSPFGILVPAGVGWCALLSEAVATVHGAVAPGTEGNHGVQSALCANGRMHFTATPVGPAAEAIVVALGSPRLAAGRAALGLVGVALFGVVRLIVSAEGEGLAALGAG